MEVSSRSDNLSKGNGMQKHRLGNGGFNVAAIPLGCMGIRLSYGPPGTTRR
jgi:hypothetical protein